LELSSPINLACDQIYLGHKTGIKLEKKKLNVGWALPVIFSKRGIQT